MNGSPDQNLNGLPTAGFRLDPVPEGILVLSPDPEGRRRMVSALSHGTGQVLEADNGERALAMLRTKPIRMMVSDTQVGREAFLRELRAEFPDLLLVMIASTFSEAQFAVRVGANELVEGPVRSGGELGSRLRAVMERREPNAGPGELVEHLRAVAASLEKEKELLRRRISSTQKNLKHQIQTLHRSREVFVTDLSRVMAIIDNMVDGIVFTDQVGKVILVNPTAGKMLEMPSFTLMGRSLPAMDGNRGLHSVLATHRALELSEDGEQVDVCTRKQDGGQAHYSVHTRPVQDFRGEVTGLLSLIRDVSLRAKTDQLKNQFLSIVAHELRTPLTTIKAFATILNQEIYGRLCDDQKTMVENIVAQSDRLGHEIDKIINMGRLGAADFAPDLEVVTTQRILSKIIVPFQTEANERSMTISVRNEARGLRVRADRKDIQRALRALTENAVKFTPDGGSIEVAAMRDGADVAFEVRDNGIGIASKDHDVIFERFMQLENPLTRQHGGSGMGLSFAAEIMKAHGARIEVDSELGTGATFRFRLAILEPDLVADDATERQRES
jgi:PAS domain S-box-containing protein